MLKAIQDLIMSTFSQSRSQAFHSTIVLFFQPRLHRRYISILIFVLIIRVISIFTIQPWKYLVRLHDEIRIRPCSSPPPLLAWRTRDEWRHKEA